MLRPAELSGPAPIMVWIHGGGLQAGSGVDAYYNSTYLAKDGAQIVINISYRLGILGFVNGFDEEEGRPIGGNYGLMDQQEALRFIHQNAEESF